MRKLDVIPLRDNCPYLYDVTRRLYLLGRYKDYHGPPKQLGDEIDRILPSVETVQLKTLLNFLMKKSNIMIQEVISQLVFNIPMLNFAVKTGYSITTCDLSNDKLTRKEKLVARCYPWRKNTIYG